MYGSCITLSSNTLTEEPQRNRARYVVLARGSLAHWGHALASSSVTFETTVPEHP